MFPSCLGPIDRVASLGAVGSAGRTLRLRPVGRYSPLAPSTTDRGPLSHWRFHRAPNIDCTCGVHATREPELLRRARGPTVVGSVALWGTIVEHAHGYRARFGVSGAAVPGVPDLLLAAGDCAIARAGRGRRRGANGACRCATTISARRSRLGLSFRAPDPRRRGSGRAARSLRRQRAVVPRRDDRERGGDVRHGGVRAGDARRAERSTSSCSTRRRTPRTPVQFTRFSGGAAR